MNHLECKNSFRVVEMRKRNSNRLLLVHRGSINFLHIEMQNCNRKIEHYEFNGEHLWA